MRITRPPALGLKHDRRTMRVAPGSQNDVGRSKIDPNQEAFLPEIIQHRIKQKVLQYINENDVPDIRPEVIL
jgi:hypothetical protein